MLLCHVHQAERQPFAPLLLVHHDAPSSVAPVACSPGSPCLKSHHTRPLQIESHRSCLYLHCTLSFARLLWYIPRVSLDLLRYRKRITYRAFQWHCNLDGEAMTCGVTCPMPFSI